jgi:hypothetical protein
LLLLLALPAVLGARAVGQQPVDAAPRRTAQIGRVAEAAAPRIDGHMHDACWRDAPAIGELVMVEPWLGRAPSERTVVRLLHDRHHLYIAIWCFDRQPGSIRASQRARDALLDPDDRVEILLDPFENRRTAYFFQIGAGGSIGDILITANGNTFDKPWDTVWRGASQVTDEGWTAEIEIPFHSLPRREFARTWGFNLTRQKRAGNEQYRWANPSQSVSFFRISECGTIEGFGDIDGGSGIEFVPYVAASTRRDRRAVDDDWQVDVDAGGEAYVRLSPSVTLATTFLTDFAETENDSRQINLNRFPLFFPEKRDFFLTGSGYFQFGARSAGETTFLPFFTRRIGLAADGSQIPLLAGVKLTGEAGPFEFGVLDVQADATAVVDSENLAVARFQYAPGEQTTIGLLATHGDPSSRGSNSVAGVDLYHRVPRFVGDMDLRVAMDVVGSTGSGTGDGESFGIDLESRGREWTFEAGTRWVSAGFEPALGFVRRRGTRQSAFAASFDPRIAEGETLRQLDLRVQLRRGETWQGETQEVEFRLDQLGVQWHSGDQAYLFVSRAFERVEADFRLFRDSVPVFAGDYWGSRVGGTFVSSLGRSWNGTVSLSTGDFFDGRSDEAAVEAQWRTGPLLHLGLGYQSAAVDLGPGRAFTTHVASGQWDLHFSPALSLRNLVQFDNESNQLGWQARLRWIHAPGSDFFAVVGAGWLREQDDSLVPTEQAIELKLAHSIRL